MTKPKMVGTIYTARARLYDIDGKMIGSCTDTPNAIAKAFMEHDNAAIVKGFITEYGTRLQYKDKMSDWNTCKSGYVSLTAASV